MVDNLSLWGRLQISSIEPGSYNTIIPPLVCTLIAYVSMNFYKNFHLIYINYRQVILRRSAPQNYVMMLDYLPDDLQYEQEL